MKRLILAGAGHAHAQVLLDWARAPVVGIDLVVVSPHAQAPYSGMVPGWLAGTYHFNEISIDFAALCRAAGARWVPGEITALDPARRNIRLLGDATIDYDLLSLNIGSTLTPPLHGDPAMLSMRPLARLREAYERCLDRWRADCSTAPFTVLAVGGGAAGVESLLAVLRRLRSLRPDRTVQGRLMTRDPVLLPTLAPAARHAAQASLAAAGVTLALSTAWTPAHGLTSDLTLWATGAQAHDWLQAASSRGDLATDERGFVRIDDDLRSLSHPSVFAAGDCARWSAPLPKAGVFAVRMGPVLSHNLRASLMQQALRPYRPQHRHLVLLATADGQAIASRGSFGAQGRWAWRWKDWIDRRFVGRFNAPTLRT